SGCVTCWRWRPWSKNTASTPSPMIWATATRPRSSPCSGVWPALPRNNTGGKPGADNRTSKRITKVAAVHRNRRAAHVGRGVGGEQQQRTGQLVELAQAMVGDAFDQLATMGALEKLPVDVGFNVTRADGVAANVVAGVIQS